MLYLVKNMSMILLCLSFLLKAHRQLENVFVGSPSARARQPILSTNWNFLFFPRRGWPKAGFPNFHFNF
jgi:hypothetical protein